MSGLKTTVRITVTSPLRGVFDRAFDVTARPRDIEEREARSALQRLVWHFEAWLKKDEPRIDAVDEMSAEIAACAMAAARERDERPPSALLLNDCVEVDGICVGACIVRRYGAPGFAGGSWLCGYVDATGSALDGADADEFNRWLHGPEITYAGRGVPGCDGAPSTGWWIGFDTAHPGMEDETTESVEETIRALAHALDGRRVEK